MIKHTPGPWKLVLPSSQFHRYFFITANRAEVAKVPHHTEAYVPYLNSVREADARLIAAAPELLAALKAIYDLKLLNVLTTNSEKFKLVHHYIMEIPKLINKAEGK